jgi:uncharacterized damage-inducible protein DinB
MTADQEILNAMAVTRDKTLEVLEVVPDDWLCRKPDGEQHSMGWVFQHIASGEAWWLHRVMKDQGDLVAAGEDLPKRDIAQLLRDTAMRMASFFGRDGAMEAQYDYPRPDGQTRPLTGRWCALYLLQHEVHHRGKIVLALRQWGLKGIPFIPYSGWQ